MGFSVAGEALQLWHGIREVDATRVDEVRHDRAVRQLREKQEIRPNNLDVFAVFVGDAERILAGSVWIAIPERETLALRFDLQLRRLPIIQRSGKQAVLVAE